MRRHDRLLVYFSHRARMDATPLLATDDARLYRSCVGAIMYYVLDRTDAQLEVSIFGSSLRAPTTGAMEALRSVTRYLLGTQDAHVTLRIQSVDPVRPFVTKVTEQWSCGS